MRVVIKFGGTSVQDVNHINKAAQIVRAQQEAGHQVVVVVSAMAGTTNQLIDYIKAFSCQDSQEYSTVVSSGEQITSGLMALALQSLAVQARSWQGWQILVRTKGIADMARISHVETEALESCLHQGVVPVVAGFQGIDKQGRVTTLGRGGSDTSAVALAKALKAHRCDIYTDVEGVYTANPTVVPTARLLSHITYEEMLELSSLGARVLQTRAVKLAMVYNVPLRVCSTFATSAQKEKNFNSGTHINHEGAPMEQGVISGISYTQDEAKLTLRKVADKPGVAAAVFGPLAEADINVDMIVQNVSEADGTTDLTFTVAKSLLPRALEVIETHRKELGYKQAISSHGVSKVSAVGVGMRDHSGVALTMFRALSQEGINILAISTSEIKISVLIDTEHTQKAVQALHAAYNLCEDPKEEKFS